MNENFLWASMLWGAIGSGYLIYGWRQRAALPLLGGVAITVASMLLPALPMSLACIAAIGFMYWRSRRGD